MHNRDCIWAAAVAWSIGLSGLLCEHFQPSASLVIGVRALFAVVTCGAVSVVLIGKARDLAGTSPPELYQFTRLVSRWVYIMLYALAVMRVSLYLYEASGTCTLCKGTHVTSPVRSLDDFQFYVTCCVVPLWVVRAVALALPFKARVSPR